MRPIENLKDNAVPATGVRLKYRVMSIIKKASVALKWATRATKHRALTGIL